MKFLSAVTIFLSIFSVSGRDLIGQDPKTWSPEVNETVSLTLTCDQCKSLVGVIEVLDICPFLPEQVQDACEAILPALVNTYTPEVVCEKVGVCEKKHWWTVKNKVRN